MFAQQPASPVDFIIQSEAVRAATPPRRPFPRNTISPNTHTHTPTPPPHITTRVRSLSYFVGSSGAARSMVAVARLFRGERTEYHRHQRENHACPARNGDSAVLCWWFSLRAFSSHYCVEHGHGGCRGGGEVLELINGYGIERCTNSPNVNDNRFGRARMRTGDSRTSKQTHCVVGGAQLRLVR